VIVYAGLIGLGHQAGGFRARTVHEHTSRQEPCPQAGRGVACGRRGTPRGWLCDIRLTTPKAIAAANFNDAPVGSGPYTLDTKATTRGSVYTLVKNDSYWDSKTYPYKKLVLKVITSSTAALNALKTGQIDGSLVGETDYNEATDPA
jgi:hypothetical protein